MSAVPSDPVGGFITRRAILAGGAAGVGAGLLSTGSASALDPPDDRYVLRERMPLNVKDYGAIGDGSTDDNSAIQSALTAGAGGAVFLPPGRYSVTGLTIPSDTELFGAGWTSQLLVRSSAGIYPLYAAPGKHDIHLHDFSIDGNKANITGNSNDPPDPLTPFPVCAFIAAGTKTSPCLRVHVDRLRVFNQKRLGIVFQNVQAGAVRDCLVEDNERDGITVYFDSKNLVIRGNSVARCGDDYIGINSEDGPTAGGNLCENIVVAENTLTGPGSNSGRGRGMTVRGGKSINVVGNVIADVSQSGIKLQDYLTTTLTDVIVADNVIEHTGYLGSSDGDGVIVDCSGSNIRRVVVEGNKIRATAQNGIRLRNSKSTKADDDLRDIVLRGNAIHDSGEGGIGFSTGTGHNDYLIEANAIRGGTGGIIVDAGTLKRIHVRGNMVSRTSGNGIRMRLIAAGSIQDNQVFDDRGGSATQTVGINLFGLSGNFMFGGNTVWGNTTADYQNDGSHSATFQGPYLALRAGTTWDPGSLANGSKETKAVTVAGAAVGDECAVSLASVTNAGWTLTGVVTAANTVTATLVNNTGGTVDLGSGALRATVWKWI
jgi:hypothetical protein